MKFSTTQDADWLHGYSSIDRHGNLTFYNRDKLKARTLAEKEASDRGLAGLIRRASQSGLALDQLVADGIVAPHELRERAQNEYGVSPYHLDIPPLPRAFGPSVNSVIQSAASERIHAEMLAEYVMLDAQAASRLPHVLIDPDGADLDEDFDEEPDGSGNDGEDEPLFTALAYTPCAGDRIWIRPTRPFELGQEVAMSLEEPWTIVAPTAFLPAVGTVVHVPPADSETRLVLVEIGRVSVQ